MLWCGGRLCGPVLSSFQYTDKMMLSKSCSILWLKQYGLIEYSTLILQIITHTKYIVDTGIGMELIARNKA